MPRNKGVPPPSNGAERGEKGDPPRNTGAAPANTGVSPPNTVIRRPAPVMCRSESYWTCLTTTYKPNRKTLDRRWLRYPCNTSAFAAAGPGDLTVSDAASTFAGPIGAFAACSHKHDRFPGMLRPVLLPKGLAALRAATSPSAAECSRQPPPSRASRGRREQPRRSRSERAAFRPSGV